MIDKSTCEDYVQALFGDTLYHLRPTVELFVAIVLLVAIISVAILLIVLAVDVILPYSVFHIPEIVEKFAKKYFKILAVLTVIALIFYTYKEAIIREQYKEIINENIQDIQSNMYLVQNDTRGYSKGGSYVINDDKDGKYSYTIFVLKDNSYYYIELNSVETHVINDKDVQGVKYEIDLKDSELYMTKYIGSNT